MLNNNGLMVAGGGPLFPLAPDRFRNQRPTLNFLSEADFELKYLTPDQIELTTKEGIVTRYRRARPWSASPTELSTFEGRYYSDELFSTFDVTAGEKGLKVTANLGNTIEFVPVERDTFQVGLSLLRFVRNKAGKVNGLEYTNPLLRKVKFTRASER
jgi:hypothetical protein